MCVNSDSKKFGVLLYVTIFLYIVINVISVETNLL